MRSDSVIRLRIPSALKKEWQERAQDNGISLSHALRTAGRLGMLAGPGKLQNTIAGLDAMRRELHAANADLKNLCSTAGIDPGRVRAAVASVNQAADAVTDFLRRR